MRNVLGATIAILAISVGTYGLITGVASLFGYPMGISNGDFFKAATPIFLLLLIVLKLQHSAKS